MRPFFLQTALLAFFCCYIVGVRAQNTENDRARDYLQRFQLGALAALDSSFLSAADKSRLIALQADHSPAAICARGSYTDCSVPNTQPGGLKLTGERLDKQHVKLDWQTSTETNSSYFVLERRSLTDTLRYDSITAKAGQGNSAGVSKYNYTDPNDLSVATYYRVKEVSLDGTFFLFQHRHDLGRCPETNGAGCPKSRQRRQHWLLYFRDSSAHSNIPHPE